MSYYVSASLLPYDRAPVLNSQIARKGAMFDDKLVFSAGSFGDEGIFLYELSPDRLTLLTSDEAWDEYSRFSPDARKIAFGSTQSDKQGIRIMNVDGSGAKPI